MKEKLVPKTNLPPVIETRNVSLAINGRAILDSISLRIFQGEYVSIVGPNGAGKTTFIKCLMRILQPEGEIDINGHGLNSMSQKTLARHISYVPQSDGRLFPFSVEEFILLGRYPHLSPFTALQPADKAAVKDALELTETTHLAKRQINTLSGGEKQTVFIAAALAQGAGILLLDEPTTFLDPKHVADIYHILHAINTERKMTILAVTHDINHAALQSDRIVIFKNGAVFFSGSAEAVMKNEILEPAYDKKFIFLPHPVTGQPIIAPEVVQ